MQTTASAIDVAMNYGPYIAVGVVVLIALIVIPLVVRKSRRGQRAAAEFQRGPGARGDGDGDGPTSGLTETARFHESAC